MAGCSHLVTYTRKGDFVKFASLAAFEEIVLTNISHFICSHIMDYLVDNYDQALSPLDRCNNISIKLVDDLWWLLYKLHQQKRFSEPMPTIGMYIALASLGCILPMVADLSHGWRNKKLWIPCKYFTLNAVSLTVIAVAMKLPMDLTTPMPGVIDQKAKLGSVAFMCIMMAYLLPSLATMNTKELVTNIVALGLLVITLVVNVCIQINTGLVSYSEKLSDVFGHANREIAIAYVAMLLMLLMIHICSALMIVKSKVDLEHKYQEAHEKALKVKQQSGQSTVEKLKEQVINYGIIAESGSPQLMIVCSATSSASVVICASVSILYVIPSFLYTLVNLDNRIYKACDSDYKWSILVIFIIQSIGIILGGFALYTRFLETLTFKLSIKGYWNLIKFYEVESCWTHTLSDWKRNRQYSSSNPNFKFVFYKIQIVGLTLLTHSQKVIVRTCKAIRIIPLLICLFVDYCVDCVFGFVSWFVFRLRSLLGIQRRQEQNRDFRKYVLKPQDDMELEDLAVHFIINYVERSIKKAEKQQPSKLMELLGNFTEFEGVKKFDILCVQSLPGLDDYPNCWSLPVVTLATIALSLRKIEPGQMKNFLNGVSEGLVYVKLVEKSLNNKDELVSVQIAAERLWLEVEVYHKWLENNLQDPDCQKKTAVQIVKWFNEKATNMVTAERIKGICANSMRRITEKMLLFYQNRADVSHLVLFNELSSMISDILSACLSNLPQVIALKCHTSTIEKRVESVHAAATLLGKTTKIINTLQARNLPDLKDDLPFIDKWRKHLMAPAP